MSTTLKFQFSGRAELKYRDSNSKEKFISDQEIVPELNNRCLDIADEISRELKRSFPPGLRIDAEIDFSPGSIEWVGFVYVLDWMARLCSSIGLIDYMKKAIEHVVNRIVRNRIRNMHPMSDRFNNFSTEAFSVPELVQPETTKEIRQNNKFLYTLLITNTLLSLLILLYLVISGHIIK